jgi:hypothetical protein
MRIFKVSQSQSDLDDEKDDLRDIFRETMDEFRIKDHRDSLDKAVNETMAELRDLLSHTMETSLPMGVETYVRDKITKSGGANQQQCQYLAINLFYDTLFKLNPGSTNQTTSTSEARFVKTLVLNDLLQGSEDLHLARLIYEETMKKRDDIFNRQINNEHFALATIEYKKAKKKGWTIDAWLKNRTI